MTTMVELLSVAKPDSGAGHIVGSPKSTQFLLHMLKNAKSNAELQGLDVNSLVIEHICVNKVSKIWCRTYRAYGWSNTHMSTPCHVEMTLLKKSRLFLNQRRRLQRRKRHSRRN